MGELDCACGWKGQRYILRKAGRKPQQPGSLGFVPHQRGVAPGIEIGVLLLEGAGNAFIPDDPAVILDGSSVGLRILPGLVFAVFFDQRAVDIAVLRGDFGGGVLRLAAGDAIRLEHHHTQAGFLEKPGGEKAGDAGADDGDIGAFVLCQPLPRLKYTVFCPERFHINTSLSRDFGLTVPGIPVRYTPKERYNREKMCAGDDSLPNM